MFRDYRRTLAPDRRHLLEQFELAHFARKVVGVGSVGTRAWIALLLGRDDGDPLFLQLKEAQPSVLEPFLGRSDYDNGGQRVVAGQRLMQAASDIFLGWKRIAAGLDGRQRDFYVRQLHDWKGSADVETHAAEGHGGVRRGCAAGRSPAPTRDRATGSRSPPTSAAATSSTRRSSRSRRRTPTRTSATTTRSSTP